MQLPQYLFGLDLGQVNDPSALIGAEWRPGERRLDVNVIEQIQLGTTYPQIVKMVCRMSADTRLRGRCVLAIDGTGVGRPVVDLFGLEKKKAADWSLEAEESRGDAVGLFAKGVPISITGGRRTKFEGGFLLVPKRDLVVSVKVLLEQGVLRIGQRVPQHALLIKELDNFSMKIDARTAHDSYSAWREGEHDDLVLGTAMITWLVHQELKRHRRKAEKEKDPPALLKYYTPRTKEELAAMQAGWTLNDLIRANR
jgi:hypothetical protein